MLRLLIVLLLTVIVPAKGNQCDLSDELEINDLIHKVANDLPPPPPVAAREPFVFRRSMEEFDPALMPGVTRAQNAYKGIYQQVVSGRVDDMKLMEFSQEIKRQIGDKGFVRALSPEEVADIRRTGSIPRGQFFSHPESGAHVGHAGNMIYVRCKNPNCQELYFRSMHTPTGSGIVADENIPLEDIELIVPDVEAAAEAVGIPLP